MFSLLFLPISSPVLFLLSLASRSALLLHLTVRGSTFPFVASDPHVALRGLRPRASLLDLSSPPRSSHILSYHLALSFVLCCGSSRALSLLRSGLYASFCSYSSIPPAPTNPTNANRQVQAPSPAQRLWTSGISLCRWRMRTRGRWVEDKKMVGVRFDTRAFISFLWLAFVFWLPLRHEEGPLGPWRPSFSHSEDRSVDHSSWGGCGTPTHPMQGHPCTLF